LLTDSTPFERTKGAAGDLTRQNRNLFIYRNRKQHAAVGGLLRRIGVCQLIEQLMELEKIAARHIPMGLFCLAVQVEYVRKLLVEQLDDHLARFL
jgi:hypothetical protein